MCLLRRHIWYSVYIRVIFIPRIVNWTGWCLRCLEIKTMVGVIVKTWWLLVRLLRKVSCGYLWPSIFDCVDPKPWGTDFWKKIILCFVYLRSIIRDFLIFSNTNIKCVILYYKKRKNDNILYCRLSLFSE